MKNLSLYLVVLLSMISDAYTGTFDAESMQRPQIQNIKLISFSAEK